MLRYDMIWITIHGPLFIFWRNTLSLIVMSFWKDIKNYYYYLYMCVCVCWCLLLLLLFYSWQCTPIQYDVHAYHSVMMFFYSLWCILDVDDAYLMMRMHTLWRWCIPYDKDAYLWWWCMTMHGLCSVQA